MLVSMLVMQMLMLAIGFDRYGAHPDELGFRVYDMMGWDDWRPYNFYYPTTHLYTLKISAALVLDVLHFKLGLADYTIHEFNRFGRAITGLMTVGLSILAWLIARESGYTRTRALIFPALFASFPLLTNLGRYNTTDVPNLFWTFLAIWVTLRACRNASLKWWVAAGVASGVAVGVKYLAALFLPAFAAALILADAPRENKRWIIVTLCTWGAAVGAGFMASTPYLLIEPRRFLADFIFLQQQVPTWNGTAAPIGALGIPRQMVRTMNGLAVLFTLPGAAVALRQFRNPLHIILLLSGLTIYLFMAKNHFYPLRFVLPLYAISLLLAAIGANYLLDTAQRKLGRRGYIAAFAMIIIMLGLQLRTAMAVTYNFLHETRYEAARWLQVEMEPGEKVGMPAQIFTYFPVQFMTADEVFDTATTPWTGAEYAIPPDVQYAMTSSLLRADPNTTAGAVQLMIVREWDLVQVFSEKKFLGSGPGPTEFLAPEINVYRRP